MLLFLSLWTQWAVQIIAAKYVDIAVRDEKNKFSNLILWPCELKMSDRM